MFNVRDIVRNNSSTFYDFDTRERRSQRPRVITTCLVALIMAVSCPRVSDNLVAGFLAVQSILLGFTVNVMFFLLGNPENDVVDRRSIEAELRSERLRDLYHELFYNVSYFNLIAVASIVIATAVLFPAPEVPDYVRGWPPVEAYVRWLDTSPVPTVVSAALRGAAMFAFYAVAIEVIFSIARVIGRTTFYFERKMDQMRDPAGDESH